jgi:hypothetical protein
MATINEDNFDIFLELLKRNKINLEDEAIWFGYDLSDSDFTFRIPEREDRSVIVRNPDGTGTRLEQVKSPKFKYTIEVRPVHLN